MLVQPLLVSKYLYRYWYLWPVASATTHYLPLTTVCTSRVRPVRRVLFPATCCSAPLRSPFNSLISESAPPHCHRFCHTYLVTYSEIPSIGDFPPPRVQVLTLCLQGWATCSTRRPVRTNNRAPCGQRAGKQTTSEQVNDAWQAAQRLIHMSLVRDQIA